MVWIIGRLGTKGSEEYGQVHALQDRLRLTPLSAWTGNPADYTLTQDGAEATASPSSRTTPVDQVAALDGDSVLHPAEPADGGQSAPGRR
jgi:hypothetical protein